MIVATAVPRMPSSQQPTLDLSGLELEIGQARDRAFRLRAALAPLGTVAAGQIKFTYVLVDCPPSLNILTINAMAAAEPQFLSRYNVRFFACSRRSVATLPENCRVGEKRSKSRSLQFMASC